MPKKGCLVLKKVDYKEVNIMENKLNKKLPRRFGQVTHYSDLVRRAAVRDYLSGLSRSEVAFKYGIKDPTSLSHWKRTYASSELITSSTVMIKRRKRRIQVTDNESEQSRRIKELERALSLREQELLKKTEELKKLEISRQLSETLVDLAEEYFKIDIRKNFGAKQ